MAGDELQHMTVAVDGVLDAEVLSRQMLVLAAAVANFPIPGSHPRTPVSA